MGWQQELTGKVVALSKADFEGYPLAVEVEVAATSSECFGLVACRGCVNEDVEFGARAGCLMLSRISTVGNDGTLYFQVRRDVPWNHFLETKSGAHREIRGRDGVQPYPSTVFSRQQPPPPLWSASFIGYCDQCQGSIEMRVLCHTDRSTGICRCGNVLVLRRAMADSLETK
jgi:hypothetical protein